ncbi:hypothetical protein FRC03_005608 [Tulasnella sp. 419]|nr:hypothetical protein FRC03_005608 [Tulasnella sp. 419]
MSQARDIIVPTSHVITGWVNGNLYSPTTEVFGILPVPGSIQAEVGMTEFNPDSLDAGQHQHRYLAKVQNTRFAVISVHSKAEKDLFSEMMAKNSFSPSGNGLPNWKHGAKIWNEKANGSTIFYKLHEHLRAYHTEWVSIANQKLTQAQSKEIRQAVDKRIRSEQRSLNLPGVPQTTNQVLSPTAGLLPPAPPMTSIPDSTPSTSMPSSSIAGSKRQSAESSNPSAKAPRNRTCMKCGDQKDCRGRGGVQKCQNPCRDCEQTDCNGRRAKQPNVPCENSRLQQQ